jgi:hypothetical protein
MLEVNKLKYYSVSFLLIGVGAVLLLINGFMYLIMNLAQAYTDLQKVKERVLAGGVLVGVGFFVFCITILLDYKNII